MRVRFTAVALALLLAVTSCGGGSDWWTKQNCLFGDGKGIASVTITTSSQLAGSGTYDHKRESAGKRYGNVTDVPKGDKAYIAVGDTEAEAVMIREDGSYTLTLSSFSFDKARYEQTLQAMLDGIPS